MKQKPGVMIYFDMRPTLDQLSDKDAGILFRAILEYGQTGREGELPNRLRLLWPIVKMRLDTDQVRYEKVVIQRQYASYARWAKRNNTEPISYEDWVDHNGYRITERDTAFELIHTVAKNADAHFAKREMPYTTNN